MQRQVVIELAALCDKYRQLLGMRREGDALAAQGIFRLDGPARDERYARARQLAGRFPGALRELDALDAAALAARLAEVEQELEEAERRPRRRRARRRWIRLVLDYHEELRLALLVKRWLGSRRRTGGRGGRPRPDGVDARVVAAYASPPAGRIVEVVWRRLARRYRCPAAELRAIVYPPLSLTVPQPEASVRRR